MRWQLLALSAHFVLALRGTDTATNAEYGRLINCSVDGVTVFTQTATGPQAETPKFESKWTNTDNEVIATVSGLFTIGGTYQRSDRYSGTLTVTSATVESTGVPQKMIDGAKKWATGVQLKVKFGLTTAQITGEAVSMEFSNGRIKHIAYGELVDSTVDAEKVFNATAGQYPARMVLFDNSIVVAQVDGLYTVAGKFSSNETKDSFTIVYMEIVDSPTAGTEKMVEGLKKWTAGVRLTLSRDDLYSTFSGEGVKMKYARMAVHKGDLINCRRDTLPIYQKDVDASYKYKFDWSEKPDTDQNQIVTITVSGLCTIIGAHEVTLEDQHVLTVKTIELEESVDPDAENMLGGLLAWTSGDVLNVSFGETTLISNRGIQLEFRNEV